MGSRESIGEFEQLAMLAIWRLGESAYGIAVREEIETVADRGVSIGALYTTLDRLEMKGLIKSQIGDSTPERGGRAKRYFTLTIPGELALRKSLSVLRKLANGFLLPEEGR